MPENRTTQEFVEVVNNAGGSAAALSRLTQIFVEVIESIQPVCGGGLLQKGLGS